MKANCVVLVCCFIASCVFGDDVTVEEGKSVFLKTDIQKKPDDTVLWYFEDNCIALINKDQSTSCTYDGEDARFRDRLEVDYETAFLTITDLRFELSGLYEAELIRSESSGKRKNLNRNRVTQCDSAKTIPKNNLGDTIKKVNVYVKAKTEEESSKIEIEKTKTEEEKEEMKKTVVGICAAVLLLVTVVAAAGVIYYCRKVSKNAIGKNKNNKQSNYTRNLTLQCSGSNEELLCKAEKNNSRSSSHAHQISDDQSDNSFSSTTVDVDS